MATPPSPRAPQATPPRFEPSGFFALRAPLLPFAALTELGPDRATSRERLREAVARPAIREALFLASPSLEERLSLWLADPDSEKGQGVERAVYRYFARMAGRPTPFGLCAGTALGRIGDQTRLQLEPVATLRRHTRLDMDYLFALAEQLARDPELRPVLRVRPNSGLYRAERRLRYFEARLRDKVRSYALVALTPDEYLEATLARAQAGATPAALARALVQADPEIPLAEAEGYLAELLDSQVLVAELFPALTGPEPLAGMITELRGTGLPRGEWAAGILEDVRQTLAELDNRAGGGEPATYRAVAARLEPLGTRVELPRLFQVDSVRVGAGLELGPEVIETLRRGAELLRRLTPAVNPDLLLRFRTAFTERYEEQEVPLTEALDEEVGIGAALTGSEDLAGSPILAGLPFGSLAGEEGPPFTGRSRYLLRRVHEVLARHEHVLELTARDLERLEVPTPGAYPDAFAIMATLARPAAAAGAWRIWLRFVGHPSGAELLGRFCHADPELHRQVLAHLRREEAFTPDALLAEVVHLPEGRVGNVLLRPVLRDHEIPFLGRSGVAPEREIPIADLLVSVREGRIRLRSARLGREVIPRLTTAHNVALGQLRLYNFLGQLQLRTGDWTWQWGALEGQPFLPRVTHGELVLSRACWTLGEAELAPLRKLAGAPLQAAAQVLRERFGWPRWLRFTEGDNELPVDLDQPLSVETFLLLARERQQVRLTEEFPGPAELVLAGPEGYYNHELIIPCVRVADSPPRRGAGTASRPTAAEEAGQDTSPARAPARPGAAPPLPAVRTFPPGSAWLFAKLYCGRATSDMLLRELVTPWLRELGAAGLVDRWFFLRYADPGHHLRVRVHGLPAHLLGEALPRLHARVAPFLAERQVSRLTLDTYEREVERYGGPVGVELAEQLFQADSEAVLALLAAQLGDEEPERRWQFGMLSLERLLDDFGLEPASRRDLLEEHSKNLRQEHAHPVQLERKLGERFRQLRSELTRLHALREASPPGADPQARLVALLDQRSRNQAPVVAALQQAEQQGHLTRPLRELLHSYLHLAVNRVVRSAARQTELVLTDLLARLWRSRIARDQSQPR